ncbi:DNA-binding response regulator, OmpR family, contains REC and winged-helix (wHTH) domain [Amycolatopsis marina]|uniref:DNA-binding response regulator, OmpR family, contains REC and winged-helix (WHTH) domain n=1 Tax=Amycolatopsis marina TaxID=490629 RepID=A0A1I1AQX9_9PSEU|nr:response regulator transcription factor [Amycolatopsis marina]SFB40459.1 DNA-binding response regulator, OmpR family, contains REC and winged-helix (wHTH) domain [Amycolatopsis marina]
MYSVLLVEDDPAVRAAIVRTLNSHSYSVLAVGTAAEALRETASSRWDMVVLDLGLPDLDGSAALRMIRGVSDVPVIVATARRGEASVVRLLDDGADDYVVKPFSGEHLLARIRALLRRTTPAHSPGGVLEVGELRIDVGTRVVSLAGRELTLTKKEFDLLAYLAEQPGQVVTKRAITEHVWHDSDPGSVQSIDVHVSWLRRKLGETAAAPRHLHTVRGVGLKLTTPS